MIHPVTVTQAYRRILQREPDPSGLELYSSTLTDPSEIDRILLASDEYRNDVRDHTPGDSRTGRRILLVGAYGNGNFGDAIQPYFFGEHFSRLFPELEVWAGTTYQNKFYPGRRVKTLHRSLLYSTELPSWFDAIFVAGGGLLTCSHTPICSTQWQDSIAQVPIGVLSCGASQPGFGGAAALLSKARFIGVRSKKSAEAVSARFLAQPVMMPDPVLAFPGFEPHIGGDGILWNPRWSIADHRLALQASVDTSGRAVLFEPGLDQAAGLLLGDVHDALRIDTTVDLFRRADVCYTERYHGAILALQCGTPVFGCAEQKVIDLLHEFGLEANTRASFPPVGFDFLANIINPTDQILGHLSTKSAQFDIALRQAIEAVLG
jgi:hypothetical protein